MDDGYEERINQHVSKRTCILKYPVVRTKKEEGNTWKGRRKLETLSSATVNKSDLDFFSFWINGISYTVIYVQKKLIGQTFKEINTLFVN